MKELKEITSKTKYLRIETLKYKDGIFEAGLVKNSPHKKNTIYLKQRDLYSHLRNDEAIAIIRCLSMALWCKDIFTKTNYPKTKWLSLKKLEKEK